MTLTAKQKEVLKQMVEYKCESCKENKTSKELHIHRIKRGYQGGEYIPRNCMVICFKCHGLFHWGEFNKK